MTRILCNDGAVLVMFGPTSSDTICVRVLGAPWNCPMTHWLPPWGKVGATTAGEGEDLGRGEGEGSDGEGFGGEGEGCTGDGRGARYPKVYMWCLMAPHRV